MARFRGTIRGNRDEASRVGSERNGMHAEVNGWDVGVRVDAEGKKDGGDRIYISVTGGSNSSSSRCIGYVELAGGMPIFVRTEG